MAILRSTRAVALLLSLIMVPFPFLCLMPWDGSTVATNSTLSTFQGGISNVSFDLQPGALNRTVYLDFPAGSDVYDAQMSLTGIHVEGNASFNETSNYDFLKGSYKNVTIMNDAVYQNEQTNWWDSTWSYAILLNFDQVGTPFLKQYISTIVNMGTGTKINATIDGPVDWDSFRVVEYDGTTPLIYNDSLPVPDKYLIPHRAERQMGPDHIYNDKVKLTWVNTNTGASSGLRTFMAFFDTTNRSKPAPTITLDLWDDVVVATNPDGIGGDNDTALLYQMGPGGAYPKQDVALCVTNSFNVIASDLNVDGLMDIVAISDFNQTSSEVNSPIFYQRRVGTVTSWVTANITTWVGLDAAVGLLNADTWPDLVVANSNKTGTFGVGIFYGSSTGFASQPNTVLEIGNGVTLADVNNDGFQDVIVAQYSGSPAFSHVYLGSPGGPDNIIDINITTSQAFDCAVADLDRDGHKDIIFAQNNSGAVYYANETGAYPVSKKVTLNVNSSIVEVGDFNGDGFVDIVLGNKTGNGAAYVFMNNDTGLNPVPLKFESGFTMGLAAGDLDHDGREDLGLAQYLPSGVGVISMGGPSGPSSSPTYGLSWPGNANGTAMAFGDIDGYDMLTDLKTTTPHPYFSDIISRGANGKYVSEMKDLMGVNMTSGKVAAGGNITFTVPWPHTDPSVGVVLYVWGSNITSAINLGEWFDWGGPLDGIGYALDFVGNPFPTKVEWVNVSVNYTSLPTNVTIDVGADGSDEWTRTGPWNETGPVVLSSGDLANAIQQVIRQADKNLSTVSVPLRISSRSPCRLALSGLSVGYNSPPVMTTPLPALEIREDEVLVNVIDLSNYFADPDGDPLSFKLLTDSPLAKATLAVNGSLNLATQGESEGNVTFDIEVRDDAGHLLVANFTVRVIGVNEPPEIIVDLRSDQVLSRELVRFDASRTRDPEGGPVVVVLWSFGDGQGGEGMVVNHTYELPGTFEVTVRAVDGQGNWNSTTFTMYVDNRPPVADLTVDRAVVPSMTPVFLDPSNSYDPDGELASASLDFGDGETREFQGRPVPVSHVYTRGGVAYTVRLTVMDAFNATSVANTTITVTNSGPVIDKVMAPTSARVGEKVTFRATAHDPDGNITQYEWDFDNDGKVDTALTDTANTSHKFSSPGKYTVVLKVIDNGGETAMETIYIEIRADAGMDVLDMGLAVALIIITALCGFMLYRQHVKIRNLKDALVHRDRVLSELKKLEQDEMDLIDEELELVDARKGTTGGGRPGPARTAQPVSAGIARGPGPSQVPRMRVTEERSAGSLGPTVVAPVVQASSGTGATVGPERHGIDGGFVEVEETSVGRLAPSTEPQAPASIPKQSAQPVMGRPAPAPETVKRPVTATAVATPARPGQGRGRTEDFYERKLEKELEEELRQADERALARTETMTTGISAGMGEGGQEEEGEEKEGEEEEEEDGKEGEGGEASEKTVAQSPVERELVPEQAEEKAEVRLLGFTQPDPIGRVRCPGCKAVIPLFTTKRPLKIVCESCGKKGIIK